MPLIKVSELHDIAERNIPLRFSHMFDENAFIKTASKILNESRLSFTSLKNYDIFLSHSYNDAMAILGLKELFESLGLKVFVDWDEEHFADREKIDSERANDLRTQMRSCKTLIFVTSINSQDSIWMPWELGYFDGYKGKVAIMPLNPLEKIVDEFYGQEYLGIYPYINFFGGYHILVHPDGRYIKLINWTK
jgi:hypothetical protein